MSIEQIWVEEDVKLLPCPFCVSACRMVAYQDQGLAPPYYDIECTNEPDCGIVSFQGKGNWEQLAKQHNRRATDTAPLYYVLRRTVGKTTLHYEYYHNIGDWVVNPSCMHLFETEDSAKTTQTLEGSAGYGSEILPIRLLVGGVE